MSLTNFLEKTHSEKIVLVEFDELEDITNSFWIKHSPNLWKLTYSWDVTEVTTSYGFGSWGWGAYGGSETTLLPTPERSPILKVGSLAVEQENYISVSSIQAAEDQVKSFYWDQPNQILYIHPPDGTNPDSYDLIGLGITQGFSNKSSYFNDLYYEGRVTSVPNISTVRDAQYYGLISFDGGSFSVINTDGYFDKVTNRGQAIRIYFGGDDLDYSEYEQVFSGYIEEIDIQADSVTFGLRDQRKLLEKIVPTGELSKSDYPNMKDDGVLKPIAYGKVRNATLIQLDQEADPAPSSFRFYIADIDYTTIDSIDEVFVDGVSVAYSYSNNIITLSDTVFTEDSKEVTCSFTTTINKPLDIIKDLIVNFTDISYTSDFFNLTEWEYYNSIITTPVSLYISESKSLIDIIGEICASVLGLFIVQGDGKISFTQQDLEKDVVKNINIDEIISQVQVTYDQSNYASSIRVGYAFDNTSSKYSWVLNRSYEENLIIKYRKDKRVDFGTLLTESIDASNLSETFMLYYGGFFPIITWVTKTQNMDIKLEDNINLQTEINKEDYIKLEIVGVDKNLTNSTITFTGKYIGDPTQMNIGKLIRYRQPK